MAGTVEAVVVVGLVVVVVESWVGVVTSSRVVVVDLEGMEVEGESEVVGNTSEAFANRGWVDEDVGIVAVSGGTSTGVVGAAWGGLPESDPNASAMAPARRAMMTKAAR